MPYWSLLKKTDLGMHMFSIHAMWPAQHSSILSKMDSMLGNAGSLENLQSVVM